MWIWNLTKIIWDCENGYDFRLFIHRQIKFGEHLKQTVKSEGCSNFSFKVFPLSAECYFKILQFGYPQSLKVKSIYNRQTSDIPKRTNFY